MTRASGVWARVAPVLVLAALVAGSACTNEAGAPGDAPTGAACVTDHDCGAGQVCGADGACSLPVGDPSDDPNGDDPPGDDPPADDPPPADPPGDDPPADDPPADPPPTDPPAPPTPGSGRLVVTAGPELVDALPGCGCTAPAPAANVDLSYGVAGDLCGKPAGSLECGVDGPGCRCSVGPGLGDALWGAGRAEEPRQPGETWIIDEQIVHESGADGTFVVHAALADDCLLSPGSLALSTNYACCLLDCDGTLGNACFDYSQGGLSCATFCEAEATFATNADCMARGPTPVRVRLDDGTAPREWCVTLTDGEAVDVVTVRRANGNFAVVSVDGRAQEIVPGAPCG
ncbi:MAG: hypothetical protein HYS27_00070 [Deltaproteobacteria bacterium]|nr:hypothetical protein [Deltaproteobacteria bacterium]